MKCILIFLSLLFLPTGAIAQSQEELFKELNDLYTQHQFKQAVPIAEKLIEMTRKKGENHPDHKESLVSLAMLYIELGEYAKALPVCTRIVAINKENDGETSDEFIQSTGILGIVYERMGEFKKAELLYKQIIETHRKETGEYTLDYAIDAGRLADLYIKSKEYGKAEPLYIKSIELKKYFLGEKDISYSKTLTGLGKLYEATGRYENAVPLYIISAAIAKSQMGEHSAEYAQSLLTLAELYMNTGQYSNAKEQYLLITQLDKRYSKETEPFFAVNINNLAEAYEKSGDYINAELLFIKASDIRKRTVGEKHPDYAASLNNLGLLYDGMGQYQKAEPLYIQAGNILKTQLGEMHPNYATSLDNLATLYFNTAQYQKAESLHIQVQKIRKKVFGENHLSYAMSLNNLARLYKAMGQYQRAEPLYMQSNEILKKLLGENHPDYATGLNNLGSLYQHMGEYEKAETLYIQSKEIREKVLGQLHPDYANSLNNLADFYHETGQYQKAEPLLRETITIIKKTQGENLEYASCLGNLAFLYSDIGQYDKAEDLYTRSKEILKNILGENHPLYATSLDNLAVLYLGMYQYEKAEPLQVQAIETRKKTLGENHTEYATSLNNLAFIYSGMEEYDKAESLFIRSKEIRKNILGEFHPLYAASLNNLAFLYSGMGQYSKAEPLYIQANGIIKKVLGETSDQYSQGLDNLGLLYQATGQYAKAEALMLQNNRIELKNLSAVFAILSEKEKVNYISARISLVKTNNSYLYNYKNASAATLQNSFNQLLVFKSLTLSDTKKMLLSVQQSNDTSIQQLLKNWQTGKNILTKQYSLPIKNRRTDIKEIEAVTESSEKELNRKSNPFRSQQQSLQVKMSDIQKNLETGEAAIEFVSFRLYNKKWTDSTIYAAYVLRKNDSIPRFIPLCEEKELVKFFTAANSSSGGIKSVYRSEIDEEVNTVSPGDSLYTLIWKPLLPYLQGIKKINYSPAGLLNRVSFPALPAGDSQLLIDKYELNQYISTRQLALAGNEQQAKERSITLFGNCSFTIDSMSMIQNNTAGKNVPDTYSPAVPSTGKRNAWSNLPGTAAEINSIRSLFEKNNLQPASYTLQKATEEQFKSMSGHSPAILHLATHGFFLPDPEKKKKDELTGNRNVFKLSDDPMLRSGIVLAGANRVWSGELPIAETEDGIVTAYEISQLDLSHTDLVVLSACETALGDIKGTEGVFGLQRAFKLAGVKNMLLSLWKVPDAETAELMTAFYKYYLEGKTARESLNHAQKDLRKKYAPYYWAAFVMIE
ncbi:MAG: CHAT domain-containing tetratricopeptide repeat protein [Bacteroidota bacterium]